MRQFEMWGDTYRFRFAYLRENGHPFETHAWLDKRIITAQGLTRWERVSTRTGIATYSEKETRPFRKETGRKLALARYLKILGFCKYDRRVVWDAYFFTEAMQQAASPAGDVWRTNHEVRDKNGDPITRNTKQEQEMWDAYLRGDYTVTYEEPIRDGVIPGVL